MKVCGICHSDDHTVCVLQHSWFISHPVLFLCMWQRGFPVACLGVVPLSPSRAVIGHTVFAWHVLLTSVGLAAALKLEAISCSEELAAVHETALNVGMLTRFPLFVTFRRRYVTVRLSVTRTAGCTVCISVFASFHSDCALQWAHIFVSPVWLVPYWCYIPSKALGRLGMHSVATSCWNDVLSSLDNPDTVVTMVIVFVWLR